MFGDGVHPDFRNLLDSKISPFLTSHAYQFWRANDKAFSSSFYLRGYSGWALRLAKIALWIGGLEEETHNFCHAPTLEKQKEIWDTKFRPVILSRWIVKVFLSNPAFLWNALGVPNSQVRPFSSRLLHSLTRYPHQAEMFLNETTTENFAIDTLDPVAYNTHIASGAYHYQYVFPSRRTRCFALTNFYLSQSLSRAEVHQGILSSLPHQGWIRDAQGERWTSHERIPTPHRINHQRHEAARKGHAHRRRSHGSPGLVSRSTQRSGRDPDAVRLRFPNSILPKKEQSTSKVCELTSTIRTLHNSLKPNGRVFWRSSAINPWYAELYRREGFEVKRLQERVIGDKTPIDRVNMYASFWQATKL